MLKAKVATQDLLRSESIDLSDYTGRNEEEKDPVSDSCICRGNSVKRKGKYPQKEALESTEWAQWRSQPNRSGGSHASAVDESLLEGPYSAGKILISEPEVS